MSGRRHQEQVEALAAGGAQTRGFPAAMRRLRVRTPLRPDAWRVLEEERLVQVYEVEGPCSESGSCPKKE